MSEQSPTEAVSAVPWRDDPISRMADDTLGTKHIARRTAQLLSETHTWESSVVVGLTGSWGSGKSSIVSMVCEELGVNHNDWAIALFTPWAAADTETLLAEFYAAIASALPADERKPIFATLMKCAKVAAPALALLPKVGSVVSKVADALIDSEPEPVPWHDAFDAAAKALAELGRPVLVIADDIDRLQSDELVSLLKVVRLLGRFPGVSYLLAYDEDALFSNLSATGLIGADSQRARLFMEKIVQYPVPVPPLRFSVMHYRLEAGLNEIFARHKRELSEFENRLTLLDDVLESQLLTPRSIERFLAQFDTALSMHTPGEIDDVDLLLLTFARMQFPEMYALIPKSRRLLTRTFSPHSRLAAGSSKPSLDFRAVLKPVAEENLADATEVIAALFPSRDGEGVRRKGVADDDYFDRYFLHSIPEDDIADSNVEAALEAASIGDGSQFWRLLKGNDADRVLKKMTTLATPSRGTTPEIVTVELLEVLLSGITDLEGGRTSVFRHQERAARWAASMIASLLEPASVSNVETAVRACIDRITRLQIIWTAAGQMPGPDGDGSPEFRALAGTFATESLELAIADLRLRDAADVAGRAMFEWIFIGKYGSVADAQKALKAGEPTEFTWADFAARCIGLQYSVSETPVPRLGDFDRELLATFANQAWVMEEFEKDPPQIAGERFDRGDLSWQNRRLYVYGHLTGDSSIIG